MPANIDMNAIRQALARRQGGGPGMPIGQQLSTPTGRLPTGGPTTPVSIPTPPQQPPSGGPQLARLQPRTPPAPVSQPFDEETRKLAKALVNKLIGVL